MHLFAKALHDLDTSQQIDIKPLSCDAVDTWPHGYSLINYMKIVSLSIFYYITLINLIKIEFCKFVANFFLFFFDIHVLIKLLLIFDNKIVIVT